MTSAVKNAPRSQHNNSGRRYENRAQMPLRKVERVARVYIVIPPQNVSARVLLAVESTIVAACSAIANGDYEIVLCAKLQGWGELR